MSVPWPPILGSRSASGAYVKRLRRVRVGQLDLPMALSLDAVDVAVKKERLKEHFVNPRVALAALPQVFLTSGQALPFSQGRRANIDSNETAEAGAECAVFAVDETGEKLAGIGKRLTSREIQPLKVLIQPRMAARDSERSEMEEITFSGVVEHGEGRGAELGFPTANLKLEERSPGAAASRCIRRDRARRADRWRADGRCQHRYETDVRERRDDGRAPHSGVQRCALWPNTRSFTRWAPARRASF